MITNNKNILNINVIHKKNNVTKQYIMLVKIN